MNFDKIASRLPGFQTHWTAKRGAEELRELFERIEFSQETYEFRAFTRLQAAAVPAEDGSDRCRLDVERCMITRDTVNLGSSKAETLMKVVLFCGGLGTRLREHSDTIPKPLVNIGYRPILWHLMRYYAHFGHKDFILCLGYRGDLIREFFLDYREAMSTDFVLSEGGRRVELLDSGIDDWRITFIDTGMHSNLGQRLLRVRHLLEGEEMFLANYSDGLSDLPLDRHVDAFRNNHAIASFLSVRPSQSFHAVRADDRGFVTAIEPVSASDYWINGGFFCLRYGVFDYIRPGEELVEQPFQRLMAEGRLSTLKYEGFWGAMDTFKDKIMLDRMEARGECPWTVWKSAGRTPDA